MKRTAIALLALTLCLLFNSADTGAGNRQETDFSATSLSATNASLNDFEAEKPPYDGPVNVPNPAVTRQGGDTFGSALLISSSELPYSSTGTTVSYTDDYDEVCPFAGSTSPDVVYELIWDAPDTLITISLCHDGTDYDTKLYMYDVTDVATPIACNDDFCTTNLGQDYVSELQCVPVSDGATYFIVIDGYSGDAGNYEMTVDYCIPPEPCVLVCPPGSIPENEPCGTDNNGGCNSTPNLFHGIAPGDTICGNAWADGGTRDTDFYQFTLTDTATITVTGCADFPFLLGFVDTADCALATSIDPVALGQPCDTITASRLAGPGTYWIFAANQSSSNTNPCGTDNDYWFTLDYDCTPIVYYPDFDGDGYGDESFPGISLCAPIGNYVTDNTDCDDNDATINPGASEVCNGEDDDCNTLVDDGLTFTDWYSDADGDGYGDETGSPTSACSQPAGMVADNTDCDDSDFNINPGASDIPGNGIDEDCDGSDAVLVQTEVVLDHVDGLNPSGQLEINTPITFHLRARYIPGDASNVDGFTNGFRIYSPTGASWQPIVGDTANIGWLGLFDGGVFVNHWGVTGAGADTVGFGGFALFVPGMVDPFNQIVWTISTQVDAGSAGDTLCIDSSFYPPFNSWLWSSPGPAGNFLPDWDGPHCFEIASSCCANAGDFNNDGAINVSDLSGPGSMVDYLFLGGAPPPCPGEGDFNGDGQLNVSDLSGPGSMVDFLFLGGIPPVCGP